MVTITDVAERAGVSKTTVSHALSGKRPVAPATRERIIQVIEELGFRPNILARNLRSQRTQMVALIIPDITNPFFPVLARGIQDTLIEHGYYTFLCNTDSQQEQEVEFVADAIQRKVDGIVLASRYSRTYDLGEFVDCSIPLVCFGSAIAHPLVDTVSTDNLQGARD
ncbi:MAG TPA: LacI family DNA-binding transcriptional regulator, partial [Ktedonobacteraceae bacterium]|nr:LacI family DNA-binding transcriptional regulator [Ktedonobacteraceae bacterium]